MSCETSRLPRSTSHLSGRTDLIHSRRIWKPHTVEMNGIHRVYLLCVLVAFTAFARTEARSVSCLPTKYDHVVSRNGCTPKTVRVKACLGKCLSREIPIDRWPYYSMECKCCQPSSQDYVYVELNCGSGTITVRVPSAVRCECQTCGSR